MRLRPVFAIALALCLAGSLAGCGVKEDLEKPNAKPVKKDEQNPSKPPSSLGQ